MFHLFRKRQSEGNLPLAEWNQGAFPFQASAGHNYDTWYWPYPAQTNQYTYFNAFYGNQLPNFYVNIPIYAQPQQQVQRVWVTSTNRQQQNAMQSQGSGGGPLMWGQQPTADYISSLGQLWAGQGFQGSGTNRIQSSPRRQNKPLSTPWR